MMPRAKQIATVNFRCQGLTLWGTPRASFRLEGKLPADVTGEVSNFYSLFQEQLLLQRG